MQALFNGHVIADSADVLVLKEANYKPVAYFPREDVEMAFLARTGLDTFCPYKGHAAYFTPRHHGWPGSPKTPCGRHELRTRPWRSSRTALAFYPNMVEIHEVGARHLGPDAAVLHTDSGGGASQKEHWPTTASNPPV